MKSGFLAFFKKEWMQLWRSGKLMILLVIFVLFGMMNPAIARLTPWLMEQMAGELEGTGLSVSVVTVDASMSFAQFFKNIPVVLILFIVGEGNIDSASDKGTFKIRGGNSKNCGYGVFVDDGLLALLWNYFRLQFIFLERGENGALCTGGGISLSVWALGDYHDACIFCAGKKRDGGINGACCAYCNLLSGRDITEGGMVAANISYVRADFCF